MEKPITEEEKKLAKELALSERFPLILSAVALVMSRVAKIDKYKQETDYGDLHITFSFKKRDGLAVPPSPKGEGIPA